MWWTKFFTGKSVEKVIDGAISGIDKLVLTNEEKTDALKKVADAQAEFAKSMLNSNTVSSKARRGIAYAIVFTFLAMIIASAVLYKFDKDYSQFIFEMAKSELSVLVLMVMGFFFGGYMASTHLIGNLKKKDKK
ncbi:MAG: hypothetical protein JXR60_12280 [Bacteroidales bacterium]|nr:hypothetical protein [Bacteroidales bacterium]